MRIHYFSSSTLISDSANSVHVTKMCAAVAQLGHDLILHAKTGSGTDSEVMAYYGLVDQANITLVRHNEGRSLLGRLLKMLKSALPFLPIGGAAAVLYGRSQSFKRHLQGDVDLIIARNMYWLYASALSAPFIYESHSPPENVFQKWIEARLFKRRNCAAVIVISDKLKDIYTDLFPGIKDKLVVAHDAADDPGDLLVNKARARTEFKDIGYVGHLYKGRGVEIIIGAARLCQDLTFHIVGGRADIIDDLKQSNIPDNIIFHGHQPPHTLSDYFLSFDAVLAPYQRKVAVHGNVSDTSAFMSPLKIFEYMSWGIPILSSDLPVLHEVLHHDKNALMLMPDDVEEWAGALKALQADPDLRARLSAASRQDFLDHYSWGQRAVRFTGLV